MTLAAAPASEFGASSPTTRDPATAASPVNEASPVAAATAHGSTAAARSLEEAPTVAFVPVWRDGARPPGRARGPEPQTEASPRGQSAKRPNEAVRTEVLQRFERAEQPPVLRDEPLPLASDTTPEEPRTEPEFRLPDVRALEKTEPGPRRSLFAEIREKARTERVPHRPRQARAPTGHSRDRAPGVAANPAILRGDTPAAGPARPVQRESTLLLPDADSGAVQEPSLLSGWLVRINIALGLLLLIILAALAI